MLSVQCPGVASSISDEFVKAVVYGLMWQLQFFLVTCLVVNVLKQKAITYCILAHVLTCLCGCEEFVERTPTVVVEFEGKALWRGLWVSSAAGVPVLALAQRGSDLVLVLRVRSC